MGCVNFASHPPIHTFSDIADPSLVLLISGMDGTRIRVATVTAAGAERPPGFLVKFSAAGTVRVAGDYC